MLKWEYKSIIYSIDKYEKPEIQKKYKIWIQAPNTFFLLIYFLFKYESFNRLDTHLSLAANEGQRLKYKHNFLYSFLFPKQFVYWGTIY